MTSGARAAAWPCVLALLWMVAARADDATPARTATWTGTFLARLEALALLETLNADLLSNDSATLTLEHWCEVHQLASPSRIVVARVAGVDMPITAQQREELHLATTEPVRHRRVRLLCGPLVLSEADNWYVPGRLTPEINRLLDTTDTPFGKAARSLHFQRHTLSSTRLWLPLPRGWEMQASAARAEADVPPMPPALLEHRAVLSLPDGTPISEVVETYTSNVLAFPVPGP
jgi:chorismate-pyruvate lyase